MSDNFSDKTKERTQAIMEKSKGGFAKRQRHHATCLTLLVVIVLWIVLEVRQFKKNYTDLHHAVNCLIREYGYKCEGTFFINEGGDNGE